MPVVSGLNVVLFSRYKIYTVPRNPVLAVLDYLFSPTIWNQSWQTKLVFAKGWMAEHGEALQTTRANTLTNQQNSLWKATRPREAREAWGCWKVMQHVGMFMYLKIKKCFCLQLCNYFTLFLRALSLHTIHLQVLSLFSVPAENHETPQLSPQENLIHMKTIGLFCNPSTNNGLVAPLHNPAKHPTSTNATV